jgi:hypothetical protein
MKNRKLIAKVLKWVQLVVAIYLGVLMIKAMKMLFFFLKEDGVF